MKIDDLLEMSIQQLASESPEIRINAATVLGELKDPRAVEPLIKCLLKDNSLEVVYEVVETLVYLKAPQAAEPLIKLFYEAIEEKLSWLEEVTADALFEILDQCTLEDLRNNCIDKSKNIQKRVAQLLENIEKSREIEYLQKIEHWLNEIKNEDKQRRLNAIEMLVRGGEDRRLKRIDSRALAALANSLNDKYKDVRRNAARELRDLIHPRAIKPLIKALNDTSAEVQEIAAEGLRKTRDPRAIPPLIEALLDENYKSRNSVAWCLGYFDDPRVVEPLIQVLFDANNSMRYTAAQSLGSIGDIRAVEPLIQLLNDESEKVRSEAVVALGKLKSYLIQLLNEHDWIEASDESGWDIRADIIDVLVELQAKEVIPILFDIFETYHFGEDGYLRRKAVGALAKLQVKEAICHLIKGLDVDGDSHIYFSIIWALGELRAVEAVEPIINIIKNEKYADLLYTAKEALLKIGEESISTLVCYLDSDTDVVKIVIAEIIGILQTKSEIPKLIEIYMNSRSNVSDSVFKSLVNMKYDSFLHIRMELKHKCVQNRKNMLLFLSIFLEKDMSYRNYFMPEILELLLDQNFSIRKDALHIMWHKPPEESAIGNIIKNLIINNIDVQVSALYAICNYNTPEAFRAVLEIFENEDKVLRQKAIHVAGIMHIEEVIPQLIELLSHDDNDLVDAAKIALARMGKTPISKLIPELESSNEQVLESSEWIIEQLLKGEQLPPF